MTQVWIHLELHFFWLYIEQYFTMFCEPRELQKLAKKLFAPPSVSVQKFPPPLGFSAQIASTPLKLTSKKCLPPP